MNRNTLEYKINEYDLSYNIISIKNKKDFMLMFDSFSHADTADELYIISFSTSLKTLIEFVETSYEKIIVILGDTTISGYNEEIKHKKIDILKLVDLMEKQKLLIYIPRTVKIHTKLYIIKDNIAKINRIIFTSANFTETAKEVKNQLNIAQYMDLEIYHPISKKIYEIIDDYLGYCDLYLGDFLSLLKKSNITEEKEKIKYIERLIISDGNLKVDISDDKVIEILGDLSKRAISEEDTERTTVYIQNLEDLPQIEKKKVLSKLKTFALSPDNNKIVSSANTFSEKVYELTSIPIMNLTEDNKMLVLNLGVDKYFKLTYTDEDLKNMGNKKSYLNKALDHFERYINTVELANSFTDELYSKSSMCEALLYMFAAPFFYYWFKAYSRESINQVGNKGPRYLCLYGESNNGKSKFLDTSMVLMIGEGNRVRIPALTKNNFTAGIIERIKRINTLFPIRIDDVNELGKKANILKSYWEDWMVTHPNIIIPQIIFTTNQSLSKDWFIFRTKVINFNMFFDGRDPVRTKVVNDIVAEPTDIYKFFTNKYIKYLFNKDIKLEYFNDEMTIAKIVMKELYSEVDRDIPKFIIDKPLEIVYDKNCEEWKTLLYNIKRCKKKYCGDQILISMTGFDLKEIERYKSLLPQNMLAKIQGDAILINNAKEFEKWCKKPERKNGLFKGIINKFVK